MNKKIIIGIAISLLLIGAIGTIAYEKLNTMYFDTGVATVSIYPFGIFPDGFSVTFDEEMPNTNYTITLEGFETPIEEVRNENNDTLFGYGTIAKECHVTNQRTDGFTGVCNWELYLTSMAYQELGYYQIDRHFVFEKDEYGLNKTIEFNTSTYHSNRYVNMHHLQQHYTISGLGNNWNKVAWQLMGKDLNNETNGSTGHFILTKNTIPVDPNPEIITLR